MKASGLRGSFGRIQTQNWRAEIVCGEDLYPNIVTNARDRVALQMREDIMLGRLRFGEKISESDYVAKFNVSRTPVREAILSLAALGLVILKPQAGTYVVSFTRASLRDLFSVRILLESGGPRQASDEQIESLVGDLTGILGRMKQPASTLEQYTEFHDFDTMFHRRLVEAPGNRQLVAIYRPVEVCSLAVRTRLNKSNFVTETANQHHCAIVEALRDRNLDAFQAVLTEHLEWVVSMALDIEEVVASKNG